MRRRSTRDTLKIHPEVCLDPSAVALAETIHRLGGTLQYVHGDFVIEVPDVAQPAAERAVQSYLAAGGAR